MFSQPSNINFGAKETCEFTAVAAMAPRHGLRLRPPRASESDDGYAESSERRLPARSPVEGVWLRQHLAQFAAPPAPAVALVTDDLCI